MNRGFHVIKTRRVLRSALPRHVQAHPIAEDTVVPQHFSPASPRSPMLWGISSFAALFLHSAARALPRRDLGDVAILPVPVGPELEDSDDSEPVPVKIQTPHSSHTEQASTVLFRIENSHVEIGTSASALSLLQPTPIHIAQAAQLTTALTGVSSRPRFTPTQSSTSRSPTPVPEGGETLTSVTATSASQNTANPTWYPSPIPTVHSDSGIAQGHAIDWHVIGIAVIAVSAVGTMILVVVFFDQWWGFLCDVCGRRRKWRGGGKEDLVPDWEHASWEFKVEDNEAFPAYPSFGSPPVIQVQEGVATRAQPWNSDIARGPDRLVNPTLLAPKDNCRVLGTQGVPCGPSKQNVMQFSPSGFVNEVTTYKCHSPLSRSNTERTTASDDAYDGLAE